MAQVQRPALLAHNHLTYRTCITRERDREEARELKLVPESRGRQTVSLQCLLGMSCLMKERVLPESRGRQTVSLQCLLGMSCEVIQKGYSERSNHRTFENFLFHNLPSNHSCSQYNKYIQRQTHREWCVVGDWTLKNSTVPDEGALPLTKAPFFSQLSSSTRKEQFVPQLRLERSRNS